MSEYVAFEPQVQVKGAAILATLLGVGRDLVDPVARKCGLVDIQENEWYLQQAWLDTLKSLDENRTGGTLNMVSVGLTVPDTANWPTDIDSIEAALFSIDVAYHMNHRNGEIGQYRAQQINEHLIDVICDNPYPCDFDYGIIYGVARRFRPKDMGFSITHDPGTCRRRGDKACVYHVELTRNK